MIWTKALRGLQHRIAARGTSSPTNHREHIRRVHLRSRTITRILSTPYHRYNHRKALSRGLSKTIPLLKLRNDSAQPRSHTFQRDPYPAHHRQTWVVQLLDETISELSVLTLARFSLQRPQLSTKPHHQLLSRSRLSFRPRVPLVCREIERSRLQARDRPR